MRSLPGSQPYCAACRDLRGPGTAACLLMLAAATFPCHAQSTRTEPDGKWRYALGAGLSQSSGNTETSTLTLTGDAAHATEVDRFRIGGRVLRASSAGVRTGEQFTLNTEYAHDLGERLYATGSLEFLRDRLANVAGRYNTSVSLGMHVVKSEQHTFDVFAGLGVRHDRYAEAATVAGEARTRYTATEAVIGEASRHTLTPTTTLHQQLRLYPNLKDTGDRRAVFESGLAVAISKALSLTATYAIRYNNDPGENFRRRDSLLVTGIQYRID